MKNTKIKQVQPDKAKMVLRFNASLPTNGYFHSYMDTLLSTSYIKKTLDKNGYIKEEFPVCISIVSASI